MTPTKPTTGAEKPTPEDYAVAHKEMLIGGVDSTYRLARILAIHRAAAVAAAVAPLVEALKVLAAGDAPADPWTGESELGASMRYAAATLRQHAQPPASGAGEGKARAALQSSNEPKDRSI